MKSSRLIGLVLVLCLLVISFVPCHAQQYSPEFQALLNQIQQTYLAPKGDNIYALQSRYPAVMATLVGHALRQQAVHVQQNPSLNNQFTSLQREAQVYIGEVARTTSARLDDGSRVTPQELWSIVNRAYQGQDDGWILQNFRVQTGTMPSVLAVRSQPEQQRRPVYDPYIRENNQIELYGMGAPPVKGPDSCENVALYFSPQCSGYRQQKEAQAEAARQKSKALNPDGIAGTWFARQRKLQLKIWKQGDVYLGSISGETSWTYNFKPKEVCLRIKYVGAGKDGPVYKGQYYGTSGAAADYRWQDITFHYFLRSGKEVFSSSPIGSPALMDFEK